MSTDRRRFRVAFDMDGVLADLSSALSVQAAVLFGDADAPADPWLAARRRRLLWQRVQEIDNFWETLDEIADGGVARLADAARAGEWETIFLTTRPETAGDPVQTQTHRWLMARGFRCPNVWVVRRSRGSIAAALQLDAIVDDRAQNCVDVVSESQTRAILVWPGGEVPDMVTNRLRLDVVSGLDESLMLLDQLGRARQQPRSHLTKLLDLFVQRPAPVA